MSVAASESRKIKVGVMGSAGNSISADKLSLLEDQIDVLAKVLAQHNCILITGETSGIPGKTIQAARAHGAFTVGISPASSFEEQQKNFNLPAQASDVVIYSGFGLMGRNVLNIRSSDIVIFIGGSIGTLNEFTIAYDENKIIGLLSSSGGVADFAPEVCKQFPKPTQAVIIQESSPQQLLEKCLAAYNLRKS